MISSGQQEPKTRPHTTDLGNAQRFARRHSRSLRYCWPWRKWLVWDGRRWTIDDDAEVMRMAKDTVRSIYREAANTQNDQERQSLTKHARTSEDARRIRAMIDLARSEDGIPIEPAALDSNSWMLNCRNGTVDLQTGEMRSHEPSSYITKLAPVAYDPTAECPTWIAFLDRIFDANTDLIAFTQRLLGYCLTGDVSEQVLPILWGTGANGKSTMLGAVMETLGEDYAIKAAPELVMMKRDAHPTERADLFGKRVVACIETEGGRRLAETMVKELTGSDIIRARRMREDHWQFNPTHKILLATNHKPEIRGTDHAIWRRIRLLPFEVTIPDDQRDRRMPERLRREMPGILAWCVRGCLDWQEHGLGTPDEVRQATSDYRDQQDVLGAFISDRCITHPDAKSKASELYKAYMAWCVDANEKPTTLQLFGEAMTAKGYRVEKRGIKWRLGIGLRTDAE